jgi:hypothetical protein
VESIEDTPDSIQFTVRPWSLQPSFVVVHDVNVSTRAPSLRFVRINGQSIALDPPHQYLPDRGILILQLAASKPATVTIAAKP